jgi:hypothetical protein
VDNHETKILNFTGQEELDGEEKCGKLKLLEKLVLKIN